MQDKIVCRVITGPTASGKSRAALKLAAEEGWEILCMDSMQVYRGMNIGTDKPTSGDRALVPHHLLDLCAPDEPFNVSMYLSLAERKIRELHAKGREFLFVGGTGLYLEGMIKQMGMGAVPADEELRCELRNLANLPDGKIMLDERLRRCDPASADKLPMNDIRRRIRAIEVSESTGVPFSKQNVSSAESDFQWKTVILNSPREILYERINRRVGRMLRDGLAEEVAGLLKEGIPENAQSMQAIGYKEMIPYLRGQCLLEDAAERIRTNSRHYAKRQMTFLKRIGEPLYADPDQPGTAELIRSYLKGNGDKSNERT